VATFIRGDNLQCINVIGTVGITAGSIYVCLNYTHCTNAVLVLNDNNVKERYSCSHFIKI
jgi:deoxyxylulose-5-phosphate synthase